jgi:hypothetical protein
VAAREKHKYRRFGSRIIDGSGCVGDTLSRKRRVEKIACRVA